MHHDSAMARQARRAPGYLETLSVQRHEAIDGICNMSTEYFRRGRFWFPTITRRRSPLLPSPHEPHHLIMSIQPRLPTEVLEAVVDEASDNPWTLHNLSLTCITLLPRSRVHLFSGLVIRTVQQLEESREFLDSCPWLAPLVLKVSIFATIPQNNSKHGILLLDVVPIHLLTRLPNLRAWTMGVEDFAPTRFIPSLALHHFALRCYRKYGGHIRSLELSCIGFHSKSDFRGLISAFTGLDSLICCGIRRFRSREQQPVMAVTVATNIQPLPISTLKVSLS